MALYPIRTADTIVKVRIKNCEPVARLQVSRKEKAPQHQKILSWVDGGKMVWCGCRAEDKMEQGLYVSEVIRFAIKSSMD